jgi:FkbH-like protein
MDFNSLRKNLKRDFTGLKDVKLAVLSDCSTQYLVQALRGYGYGKGLNIHIWEGDYDAIDMAVNDGSSPLYTGKNDYVLLFFSAQKLKKKFYASAHKSDFADHFIDGVKDIVQTVSGKIKTNFIVFNLTEELDSVFGNYGNKTQDSFIYQIRKINYLLMGLAEKTPNVFLNDVAGLYSAKGKDYSFDSRLYINADVIWSLDFTADVAVNTGQIIESFQGFSKKCLILDLDNTTWGGIIGDDGIENIQVGDLGIGKAFTQLQQWAKALKDRGIILTVCSKNNEEIAKEPFIKHPDMVLRLEDISVFVANWDNKADNIRYIQSILNIGFDSMVFLDDNPFEREMVKTHVPQLTVPDLPEDPADYIPYLATLNLFETISYTSEDKERTKQYREEADRTIARSKYTDEKDFLISLGMVSEVKPFDGFSIPRVAQLTQRSNQFNLRTIRYSEEDIKQISASPEFATFTFNLWDKFGDHGLISAVIMQRKSNRELFINTWIMSCRVLKRGVEQFTLFELVNWARANNFEVITGEYIPTPKNALVKDHYEELGFSKVNGADGLWALQISSYKPKAFYISNKN